MAKTTRSINGPRSLRNGEVYVFDYGEPEYLDGSMMQFAVYGRTKGPDNKVYSGPAIAYFRNHEDAVLFADAKNGRLP